MNREELVGKFKSVDYANDQNSQTRSSSWTGGIRQAEKRDLQQVGPVRVW